MDDRYFDKKSAEDWIALIESEGASVRENDIYPHLKKWIWDNDITSVVDLGSGQGVCSQIIPQVTQYLGVEPSKFLLKRAWELYPAVDFVEGSAYKIPRSDGSVDAIFSIAVWHLLSDLERATKELARVLKPGGHYLIITADANHEIWKNSSDKVHLYSENEIGDPLVRHGLKPTRIGAYRHFWFFEGRKI